MARIHEEYIVIKVSKLVADSDPEVSVVSAELRNSIVDVAKELVVGLVGEHVVVEAADGE